MSALTKRQVARLCGLSMAGELSGDSDLDQMIVNVALRDRDHRAKLREFSEWLAQFTANFKRYESTYKEAGGAVPEHVDSALGVLSHVSAKLSELGLRIEP